MQRGRGLEISFLVCFEPSMGHLRILAMPKPNKDFYSLFAVIIILAFD